MDGTDIKRTAQVFTAGLFSAAALSAALAGYAYSADNDMITGDRSNYVRGSLAADDTGVNQRDANPGSVTPMQQGDSDQEIDTAAKIRSEIVNSSGLSDYAKNVKVIVNGDRVLLRGPVANQLEKQSIVDIVQRVAPQAEVDDRLEIARNQANIAAPPDKIADEQ